MKKLVIDPDLCCACEECQVWLPGLLGEMNLGVLLVSDRNALTHQAVITEAISACRCHALRLETASP